MTSDHPEAQAVLEANQRFYDAFGSLDIDEMDQVWEHSDRGAVHPPRLARAPGVGAGAPKLGQHLQQHVPDALQRHQRHGRDRRRRRMGELHREHQQRGGRPCVQLRRSGNQHIRPRPQTAGGWSTTTHPARGLLPSPISIFPQRGKRSIQSTPRGEGA